VTEEVGEAGTATTTGHGHRRRAHVGETPSVRRSYDADDLGSSFLRRK
jgi:hypothetical protein